MEITRKDLAKIQKAGSMLVIAFQNWKEDRRRKLNILYNKEYDMSYLYNEIILKSFVTRSFQNYENKKRISLYKLKNEIESDHYSQRNIIIVGSAGVGKSTALKWLYVNSNIKNKTDIFLYAKMFDDCKNLEEVFISIEKMVDSNKLKIIFFDGLDELKCIKGSDYEFNKLINFIDKISGMKYKCRFVLSTRPEHFGFNKMIIRKNTERSVGNYRIVELKELSKKESYKICKSIKKYYLFDKKYDLNNFINKWPSESMENRTFTENKYLRLLKQYIQSTTAETSLLNKPVLCRYAYQIIYEWYYQKDQFKQAGKTQSERIETVLRCYIKWEFHDGYKGQTESGKGKSSLDKYINRVWNFLENVAVAMGEKDFIDKNLWYKLKSDTGCNINEAYCAIQEIKNNNGEIEQLGFIHKSFQNYFLASYYSKLPKKIKGKKDKKFAFLLNTDSEFAIMYIELLLKSKNSLAQSICMELLRLNRSISDIVEYARGERHIIFTIKMPFTIEDYLMVFPNGCCLFAGLTINRYMLRKLQTKGILSVSSIDLMTEFNQNYISKNNYIKASCYTNFNYGNIRILFYIYENGKFIFVGGFSDKNRHIEERIEEALEGKNPSIDLVRENSCVYSLLQQDENDARNVNIHDGFKSVCQALIKFMGEDSDYWCISKENNLYVYRKCSAGGKMISELFKKGLIENKEHYTYIYCKYYAMTNRRTILFRANCCTKLVNDIIFDARKNVIYDAEDIFAKYYDVQSINFRILENKYKSNNMKKTVTDLYKIFKIYDKFDNQLKYFENEKMLLCFSDEKLLTLYAWEEWEEMRRLAENTILLCRKYNHISGIELRQYLLQEDCGAESSRLKYVYEYAKNYIWI